MLDLKMLKTSKAFSSFSVDDLVKAKDFYGNTLGLTVTERNGMLELITEGNSPIMVYPKDNHESATYTVLNFPVENIDEMVDKLTAKGIKFEKYEGELETDEKGISRNGPGPLIAWFKDPAGNFLSLLQEK